MQNEIINILPNQEDYVIGFADMGDLVKDHYPYRYAIVIGKRLDDRIIDDIKGGPTPVYYELYKSVNDELNLITAKITRFLKQNAIPCVQIKSTVQEEDIPKGFAETLRMNFSHKMAATRAGLGWIGKTDLLISERFGPRIRLATVLTHHRVENIGVPVTESRCGNCDICVESCPGQAASGKLWNVSLDRDEFYDAFKCRDACRKLSRERLDKKVSLCGICVSICPFGKTIEKRKKK